MNADPARKVRRAYRLSVLRLAAQALAFDPDPEPVRFFQELGELDQARDRVEAAAVALMNERGQSWEKMADAKGVTRQSLNRRLRQRALDAANADLGSAPSNDWLAQKWGLETAVAEWAEVGLDKPGDALEHEKEWVRWRRRRRPDEETERTGDA